MRKKSIIFIALISLITLQIFLSGSFNNLTGNLIFAEETSPVYESSPSEPSADSTGESVDSSPSPTVQPPETITPAASPIPESPSSPVPTVSPTPTGIPEQLPPLSEEEQRIREANRQILAQKIENYVNNDIKVILIERI